jgi:hypothetical protein
MPAMASRRRLESVGSYARRESRLFILKLGILAVVIFLIVVVLLPVLAGTR